LAEFGIDRADLVRDMAPLIEKANMSACTFVAPRIPSRQELEKIYLCALEGSSVRF
jgi:alcohol dehydrogenase class IV